MIVTILDNNNNQEEELVSQLSELGIHKHNFTEEQQQQKYRLWEKELAIPWKKRKILYE